MARMLVTGANGFIGSHIVRRLLADGDEVSALVRNTSNRELLAEQAVKLLLGDLRDDASLKAALRAARPDVVYHTAGLVKALRSSELLEINEQGVHRLGAACAGMDAPPVLVHISSLAAAGPAIDGRLRTEDDPPAPVSNYGRSKLLGEQAAVRFADRLAISIVRPPIVLGGGDLNSLALFRPIVRRGLHFCPGFREMRASLIGVEDLVNGIVLIAQHGERVERAAIDDGTTGKGRYFLAADEAPSYAELGRMIGKAAGRERVRVVKIPPRGVWLAAACADLAAKIARRPNIFGLDKARESLAGDWLCSADKAREQLGFRPQEPLEIRLRQTVQWYREKGWV